MRRPFSLRSLLVLGAFGATAALAQQAPATAPAPTARPCAADVARLCPGAQKDHGAIRQCLQEHADQLSQACTAHIDQMKQHLQAAREACQADVAKLCPDVKPGGGRIAACLREHASELSDSCKAQRQGWRAQGQ
jgi:hypothetical protein